MRKSARLQGRKAWPLEKPYDLVDELRLSWRKPIGDGLPYEPRKHTGVDFGGAEGAELIDESAKLAGPQKHRVVLEVVDRHGCWHGVPAGRGQETSRIVYFEIQLKMKKKAAALTAITAYTDGS